MCVLLCASVYEVVFFLEKNQMKKIYMQIVKYENKVNVLYVFFGFSEYVGRGTCMKFIYQIHNVCIGLLSSEYRTDKTQVNIIIVS